MHYRDRAASQVTNTWDGSPGRHCCYFCCPRTIFCDQRHEAWERDTQRGLQDQAAQLEAPAESLSVKSALRSQRHHHGMEGVRTRPRHQKNNSKRKCLGLTAGVVVIANT